MLAAIEVGLPRFLLLGAVADHPGNAAESGRVATQDQVGGAAIGNKTQVARHIEGWVEHRVAQDRVVGTHLAPAIYGIQKSSVVGAGRSEQVRVLGRRFERHRAAEREARDATLLPVVDGWEVRVYIWDQIIKKV